jgi:hypothetical protein
MFAIDDDWHCEFQGQYSTYEEAINELKRRALIPWDQAPNCAPCSSFDTCGRRYQVIEYDDTSEPWKEIRRIALLEISSAGVKWLAQC